MSLSDERIKQLVRYIESVLKGQTLTDEKATSLSLAFAQNTIPTKEAKPKANDPDVKRRQATCVCDTQGKSVSLMNGLVQNSVHDSDYPIAITQDQAFSLVRLVKWFKGLVGAGNMPQEEGRSDELTSGYCDELLEALGDSDE